MPLQRELRLKTREAKSETGALAGTEILLAAAEAGSPEYRLIEQCDRSHRSGRAYEQRRFYAGLVERVDANGAWAEAIHTHTGALFVADRYLSHTRSFYAFMERYWAGQCGAENRGLRWATISRLGLEPIKFQDDAFKVATSIWYNGYRLADRITPEQQRRLGAIGTLRANILPNLADDEREIHAEPLALLNLYYVMLGRYFSHFDETPTAYPIRPYKEAVASAESSWQNELDGLRRSAFDRLLGV